MKTNYEVKPKKSLRPLKTGLLVLAMACFMLGGYAQQLQTAKVANTQELIKALENPTTQTLVFEESFDGSAMLRSSSIQNSIKSMNGDNKALDCVYWIQESDTCFDEPWFTYPQGPDTLWKGNIAAAGSIDFNGCNCCPVNAGDDLGTWSWRKNPGSGYDNPPPPGGNLHFIDPINKDTMDFIVSKPGIYTLRYTWGTPWFSNVQTEYRFIDPFDLTLSADDVCGLTTTVHMDLESYYRKEGADSVSYSLYNPCTDDLIYVEGPVLDTFRYFNMHAAGGNYPQAADTIQIEDFEIAVPYYGIWQFCVNIQSYAVFAQTCDPTLVCIDICFSEEPQADAGPDQDVCEDICTWLYGTTGLEDEECPLCDYYYTWVQISGPADLYFSDPNSKGTVVCRDEQAECSYGVYEVAFQVSNGECYDVDTTMITYYEQPVANAGDDWQICFTDQCFSIHTFPPDYCSDTLGERWHYITVTGPGGQWAFENGDYDFEVCPVGECVYGVYEVIVWEYNGNCFDSDTSYYTLYETPVADAGPDGSMCFYDGCFTIYGTPYEYCSEPVGEIGHSWSVTGPPNVQIEYFEVPGAAPYILQICPYGECVWGEYMIVLWENNGDICEDYDTAYFYLYEPPTANAGDDFSLCYTGGCFSLGAYPFTYCSDDLGMGERFGKWTKVGGPANVTFNGENDADADACPDEEAGCVYGWYTFVWTEYNGDCMDSDTVEVTLYEPPTADAGDDMEYCVEREFSMELWHTLIANPYQYCQETGFVEPYGYWSKSCGPGYVTFIDETMSTTGVHVSAFGCYCFVWHEVNGDCEATDTVHVCWYEHPHIPYELSDTTCIAELPACYNLGLLGLIPYEYLPEPNVNYNMMGWSQISGDGTATFEDPEDPNTIVCVDNFGCYTLAFIQYNGMEDCADTAYVYLTYLQAPTADAGDDMEICGNCSTFSANPFSYVVNECNPANNHQAYMNWFTYIPPADPCPSDYYDPYHAACAVYQTSADGSVCVCDDYCGTYYGTYGFIWTEYNGSWDCADQDTVWYTFKKVPDPLPLRGCFNPNNSCNDNNYWCFDNVDVLPVGWNPNECGSCYIQCLWPGDTVLTVCAESCLSFSIDWPCLAESLPEGYCAGGPIPGWTYEWSFIGPAGSYFNADPLWWDCDAECWKGSDQIDICFGECCDTARLYLTVTSSEGCDNTFEWKFYVQHRPDATISGPEIAEVGMPTTYSIPDPQNPCYLYIWEVQHCGVIASGQGTGEITVNWTDYNQNGGWGLIYVEVHDTCTGCCNVDSLWVKVYPSGTIGDAALSGHVYYHNNIQTPLNGVEITLWNSGVPVFNTTSFNDIEGGNGLGYFEFPGINGVTDFNITASYDAPWYGANATDALAVELKVINNLPGSFVYDTLVFEAMDVNNSSTITATDALWIKQRAISMVNYFPAGNWVFPAGMSSTAGTYDIMTLNAGDANRSNIPASMKEAPAIALVSDGVMNVVTGQEYELPIRIADANQFGAITLNLGYDPSLIDVVDVAPMEGMISNIANGNVSLAWSSINPMVLAENAVVVTLKVKALGVTSASDELFTIGLGSEFADPSAKVIEPVTLKTYGISSEPAASDYFMSANRPNPFSTSTFIEYTLPETGKVRLSVLDMLGQEIAVLVEATQSAGSYTVEFANPGLATGVYMYKITVDGESRDYVSTKRMVISH